MKIINYIDLGVHHGNEIDLVLSQYDSYKSEYDLRVYGIEANNSFINLLNDKYSKHDFVHIFNYAVTDTDDVMTKLFLSTDKKRIGSSIYRTKFNVSDTYTEVMSITLSTFIRRFIKDFENSINILKINIEGAELLVYQDLIKNSLNDKFSIYCGHPGHDIEKVYELKELKPEYYNIVNQYNFNLQYFCTDTSIENCINIFDAVNNIQS